MNTSLSRLFLALTFLSPLANSAPAAPADLILSEDFEGTAAGEIPKGFEKTGAVAVAEDAAHSGKKSLRIEAATRGPRRITKTGPEIAALGGEHWGRLYFKVQLPTPVPVIPEGKKSAVIHSTLVSGKATSPEFNDPIEVRVLDTLLGPDGNMRYIYNVQPRTRPEFATSGKSRAPFSGQWTLVEWHVDNATQTYEFFINGSDKPDVELRKGAGQFTGAEIPAVFDSLSFGWNNYQPAEPGIVAWIDDIALSKKRIGALPDKK